METLHAYPESVLEKVRNSMDQHAVADELVHYVPVTASKWMQVLAEEMHTALSQLYPSYKLELGEIQDAFNAVLEMRLAYVSGVRSTLHPRDVEYPSFLGPVLAQVGKYVDTIRNVTLVPISPTQSKGKGSELVPDRARPYKVPDTYNKVITVLRSFGVSTNYGLPRDKVVENDDLFRINVAEGWIRGQAEMPSPTTILIRSLVNLSYLSEIFGKDRVIYGAEVSLRAAISELALLQIKGVTQRFKE
jgi:hypothetical protein